MPLSASGARATLCNIRHRDTAAAAFTATKGPPAPANLNRAANQLELFNLKNGRRVPITGNHGSLGLNSDLTDAMRTVLESEQLLHGFRVTERCG